jgi:hypothetical protein
MAPLAMCTRSPVLKVGAHSWVTTLVLPSSMRKVMRYMRSPLAVVPAVLEPPTAEVPLVLLPLLPGWRCTTSMLVTVLLGAAVVVVLVAPGDVPVPDPLPAMAPLPVLLPMLLPLAVPLVVPVPLP